MKLSDFLSENQISQKKEDLYKYGKDWSPYTPSARLVVFLETREQAQKLIVYARDNHIPIVPSGGRTGLSGGATATQNEIVASFERMDKIIEFNHTEQILTCQSGTITETVQQEALKENLYFPIDFASKGSSQIGGNIATNAGGVKVIRYGLTRRWVTGIEVVTGQGHILNLGQSLIKNATGYDLMQLFLGSEGTLGLITQASLKLTSPPKDLQVLLLSLDDLEDSLKIFETFQKFSLTAFEIFSHKALDINLKFMGEKSPLSQKAPYYLLIEMEKPEEELLLEAFETVMENKWAQGGEISQNQSQFQFLWKLRENISEALSHFHPHKNDISVRISHIPDFIKDMLPMFQNKFPEIEVIIFGHIGDGNLHINLLRPSHLTDKEFEKICKTSDEMLFSLVQKYKGSISAEHGVGLLKKDYLHFTRSAEERDLMKSIKKVFDPDNILNPGKIF